MNVVTVFLFQLNCLLYNQILYQNQRIIINA